MSDVLMIHADARHIPLPDNSVQCVVTSPPYWGLRKYPGKQEIKEWGCAYGLEPTIEMYVAHSVEILREVRRVLRPDGVCFWNIGDSYANDAKWGGSTGGLHSIALHGSTGIGRQKITSGLKPKDLCLIPSRVAIAAQADGWWVRSMIVWAKPNPMPESVTDRPTDAYEHIIMLTKSERYYWDAEAVKEPAATDDMRRPYGSEGAWEMDGRPLEQRHGGKPRAHSRGTGNGGPKAQERGSYEGFAESAREILTTRNLRNVWTFPTQPYKGAHFATFPEELPRRCIMAATKPGDLVLDPFGGSGTVGQVAIELNRSAFLLDIAYGSTYGPLATKRTTGVQRQLLA